MAQFLVLFKCDLKPDQCACIVSCSLPFVFLLFIYSSHGVKKHINLQFLNFRKKNMPLHKGKKAESENQKTQYFDLISKNVISNCINGF